MSLTAWNHILISVLQMMRIRRHSLFNLPFRNNQQGLQRTDSESNTSTFTVSGQNHFLNKVCLPLLKPFNKISLYMKCFLINFSRFKYIQSTTNWHLPSTRIKSCAVTAADLQHTLKGFRVESRNEVLCAGGGRNWQDRSSDRYFQELIFMSPILESPHI